MNTEQILDKWQSHTVNYSCKNLVVMISLVVRYAVANAPYC